MFYVLGLLSLVVSIDEVIFTVLTILYIIELLKG